MPRPRTETPCGNKLMRSHTIVSTFLFASLWCASCVNGQVRCVSIYVQRIKACILLTIFPLIRQTDSPGMVMLGSMNCTTIIRVSTVTNLSKLPTQRVLIRQDGRWCFTMEMVRGTLTELFPFHNARYRRIQELVFPLSCVINDPFR